MHVDIIKGPVDDALKSTDNPRPADRNERDFDRCLRLDPHTAVGRHIETHAPGRAPIEGEPWIRLEHMKVGGQMDRDKAGVGNRHVRYWQSSVDFDWFSCGDDLPWNFMHESVLSNRVMHDDQPGAIRKQCVDVDSTNHFGDTFHDFAAFQN